MIRTEEVPHTHIKNYELHKAIILDYPGAYRHGVIPWYLKKLVKCSGILPQFGYYWWRAVSLAYILRFNQRTFD